MKANIGNYCSWIGPYQISKWFQSLPILERDREKFGDWLSETWVSDLCSWIHSKQKRKIDKYIFVFNQIIAGGNMSGISKTEN